MRLLATGAALLLLLISQVARPAAQQDRIFTTGSPAELAAARQLGVERLRDAAGSKGVDVADLAVSRVQVDAQSFAHTRMQQRYRGVPVFGGEAIAHLRPDGAGFAETDDLVPNVSVDTTPALDAARAIAIATDDYGCSRCLTEAPLADLWILRRDGVDHLAYRVQLSRFDGTALTAMPVVFVDAHTGDIAWRYDNLQTGTGLSLYSGTVSVATRFYAGSGYTLESQARTFEVFDSRNVQSTNIFDFFDPDDVWNSAYQRAAVDASYGGNKYLEYLQAAFGRNGIDGNGGPRTILSLDGVTTLVGLFVHYGSAYNNASWDSIRKRMVFGDGDGSTFSPLVTLDIAGHEMTHGLTQHTANLTYNGESGALNEAWSDAFGAMTERYVNGESANTWMIGEQAFTPGVAGDALRFMDDPHRDPDSGLTADDDPDHYSERYTGTLDNGGVHINSGIANKAFYLVAKGGTHHLGGSMTGIGADKAAQIWYRALTSYMTASTNFADARTATLNAATALYGGTSAEYYAVAAAWCMVGVGGCGVPATVSATPSSGSGSNQLFSFQYSDSFAAGNLSTAWMWIAPSSSGSSANSCLLNYDVRANVLQLLNDAGTGWSSAAPGTAVTLQNSQCALAAGSSSVSTAGTTLTVNVSLTFKQPFSGAKNLYLFAVNSSGASVGWQDRGDWFATTPSVATADSATPSTGSGASQTFALRYADSIDVTNLAQTWVWFSASMASSANSCLAYYERSSNTLFLLNDAGTAWTSATLGSAATLQNSQCAIAVGSSSTTTTATVRTVNVAMTFTAAFGGAKNIYLFATNGSGNSGWQDRGDWTVNITPPATVTADSVTPASGSGSTRTFALQYSDTAGASDLAQAWVWFNATMASAANSCLAYFDRPTNRVFLLNDAGTAWTSAVMGTAVSLQNAQCAIAVGSSSTATGTTTRTLNLAMTFAPAFAGMKNIYMYGTNGTANSGWQDAGDWQATGGTPATVTADSATPATGSAATQTFALQYTDGTGASHLTQTWAWFNASMASATNSCLAYYDQPANLLYLLNDAGTGWMTATPGSSGTLQNQQCAIDVSSSGTSVAANTLTLSLAMTFTPAFAGAKNIYLFATDGALNSGWQDRGDWTVPGTQVVTADSATPSAGSGTSQVMALQYSDSAGATHLAQTWAWISNSMASAANSCLAYYDQGTNTVFLLNDAGTAWTSATLGSAATLQNQQCAIVAGSSSASAAGTSLTLNLAMTFTSAFAGTKNVYLFATDGTSNSGWQDRGDWTVP